MIILVASPPWTQAPDDLQLAPEGETGHVRAGGGICSLGAKARRRTEVRNVHAAEDKTTSMLPEKNVKLYSS